MRLYCGSIDDVHPYERIGLPRSGRRDRPALAHSPRVAKLGGKKVSLKEKAKAWLLASEPHGDSDLDQRSDVRVAAEVTKMSPSGHTAKKMKVPSSEVGFVEILLAYHSLLQASPSSSMAMQRGQLYPTIGFVQNPRNDSP